MFAIALLLTLSRGAIAALAVVLVVYLLLSPRPALIWIAIAAGPAAAVALIVAYDASLLGTTSTTSGWQSSFCSPAPTGRMDPLTRDRKAVGPWRR